MHRLFSVVLVALSFFVACASPRAPSLTVHSPATPRLATRVALDVHADVAFTREEREQISLAAREWGYFTNGLARLRIIYDADLARIEEQAHRNLILRVRSDNPFVGWADDAALAFVVRDPVDKSAAQRMFVIVDRIGDAERLHGVLLHELGHMLWLPNLPAGARAVMSADVNRYTCPQREDMERFCAFHHCRLEDVRFCE